MELQQILLGDRALFRREAEGRKPDRGREHAGSLTVALKNRRAKNTPHVVPVNRDLPTQPGQRQTPALEDWSYDPRMKKASILLVFLGLCGATAAEPRTAKTAG